MTSFLGKYLARYTAASDALRAPHIRDARAPRRRAFIVVVTLLGAAVPASFYTLFPNVFQAADFDITYHGARFLLSGEDPYSHIGPGQRVEFPYGLYYPIAALFFSVPFTLLPVTLARIAFFASGSGLLAWAIARRENDPRALFITAGAFYFAGIVVQWEPLLVAAALTPWLGFLLAAKPTIGAALWIAYPSRRALIGCAAVAALSFLVMPDWIGRWLATAADSPTAHPLAWHPIGWIPLLALVRWRDGDARLVAALSLVPITPLPYSAVTLFAAVRSVPEAIVLSVGSWAAIALHVAGYPYDSNLHRFDYMRGVLAITCTIPMALMILLRPRAGAVLRWFPAQHR